MNKIQGEISQRLKDSLNRDVLISASLEERLDKVNRSPLRPDYNLRINGEIAESGNETVQEIFFRKDVNQKLLILGEAGAGKTTLLLELSNILLEDALENPGTFIPVLFEITSWLKGKQPIELWLKSRLKRQYNINDEDSEEWLDNELILPLLDGLDELSTTEQVKFVDTVNDFIKEKAYRHIVVCCRTDAYEELQEVYEKNLNELGSSILVKPLKDSKIKEYLCLVHQEKLLDALSDTSNNASALLGTEQQAGYLRVPLFLSIAAITYNGNLPESKEGLVFSYVQRAFSKEIRKSQRFYWKKRGKSLAYKRIENEPSQNKSVRMLSNLSAQITVNQYVEFMAEDLDPSWSEIKGYKQYYYLSFFACSAVSFMILFFPFSLEPDSFSMLSIYALAFFVACAPISYIVAFRPIRAFDSISIREAFRRKTEIGNLFLRFLQSDIDSELAWDLLYVSLSPLIIAAILLLSMSAPPFDAAKLMILMTLSTASSFFFRFAVEVFRGQADIRKPDYKGIWSCLENFLKISLILWPIVLLVRFLIDNLISIVLQEPVQFLDYLTSQRLLIALRLSVLFGFFVGGGSDFVKHFCLRLSLFLNGESPFFYGRFLNYCCERKILQRVGRRYRFMHLEFQSYFCNLYLKERNLRQ